MINIIKVEDDETLTTATVPAIRVITTGGDRWEASSYTAHPDATEWPKHQYKTSFAVIRGNEHFENAWRKAREKCNSTLESVRFDGTIQKDMIQSMVGKLVFGETAEHGFSLRGNIGPNMNEAEGPFYYVGDWTR